MSAATVAPAQPDDRRHAAPARVFVPHLAAAPQPPAHGVIAHRLQGDTMGTTWSVQAFAPAAVAAGALRAAIDGQLQLVIRQMSTWDADSDLSRFNLAQPGSWHLLPAELCCVVDAALALAASTAGAYDPTIGPVVDAWGFGSAGPVAAPPSAAALAEVRARCGYARVVREDGTRRIRQPGGVAIDLSSIAKGYAVDRVGDALDAAGVRAWLVEIGGELKGRGCKPDGQPWWVALEMPPPDARAAPASLPKLPPCLVALHELAVATSGDYRRRLDDDSPHLSHTIDPRTGHPVANGVASVAVLHAACMHADAFATALTVLGPASGLAFATQHGIAARWLQRTPGGLREQLSPALRAMLD